jgi:hypothetical protein
MIWFFVAFVLFSLLYAAARSSERKLAVGELARAYGGRLNEGWFAAPGFSFMIDGVDAEFSSTADGRGNGRTRVKFRTPVEGRLELRREGILAHLFGSGDLKLGDEAFDRAWQVYGAPERWVHGVLDPDLRARIERLALRGSGIFHPAGLSIDAGSDGVEIAVTRPLIDEPADLRGFLTDAVAIFRRLRGLVETPAGIAFLGETKVEVDGRCPLCEHALGADVRFCAACATPHHADCWDYFGGCTTYACGGTRGARIRG